jgi:hypothetical protein
VDNIANKRRNNPSTVSGDSKENFSKSRGRGRVLDVDPVRHNLRIAAPGRPDGQKQNHALPIYCHIQRNLSDAAPAPITLYRDTLCHCILAMQMNPLAGRIESIAARAGLRSSLEIQLSLNNPNDIGLEFTWVSARASITFYDIASQSHPTEPQSDLGQVFVMYNPPALSGGGKNMMVFSLPVDPHLLADIEQQRQSRDVLFYLTVNFSALQRRRDGSVEPPLFSGAVADEKFSGQIVSYTVPRSLWQQQVIDRFSIANFDALKDLSKSIKEANEAKLAAERAAKGAEDAAKAAKDAATLTAVTNLAQAYKEEAETLKHRSWLWIICCLLIAAGTGWLVVTFVNESLTLGTNFSVSIAILRAVVLAVAFGAFNLCLRVYESYRHLEVVNRHRVNIGRTFEAFKAAQPTERSQEIMSAITAEHMLAFGKSGFAPRDSPNQSPLTDFSDLIKSVLDKKS